MKQKVFIVAYAFFIGLGALFATYINAESPRVTLGGKEYRAIVVDDKASKEKGLSGRGDIADDQAMLFVFDESSQQCFWMKDMRFPLDIVWVSATNRIVHIERDVSPSTYPNTFCPKVAAKYVVETNALQTKNAQIGDVLRIKY